MPVSMVPEDRMGATPPSCAWTAVQVLERILVIQAQNGSSAAFEELIERYESRVLRLAQSITHHREDAEDVVQNAFFRAFKKLSQFRGDSSFYTWLARITINEALMKNRRRRLNEVSIDDRIECDDDFLSHQIKDRRPNPEQRCSQHELQTVLAATVNELEIGYRTVFQLRDIEGFSTEETARALDLSASAVKTRLQRARVRLRESLDKYRVPA